jgi:3-dehydroquinate dehydratase-2
MSAPTIIFINGPNANLYGLDAAGTYGRDSFPAIKARCEKRAEALGLALDFRQSNSEGEIIDWIQAARGTTAGLIINAAGLAYTSIAILDALLAYPAPIVEAHMSNIWKREPFRHRSYVSKAATGVIAGLGAAGYELALVAVADLIGAHPLADL